ncbi:PREDICTED: B3 domain-containing protein At5g26805 [Tarenaya hassleriana]|uniref:B3 domain-containing protein At5g26805 n=1 Tax=Tarenaya hassleriana TaxID=28532 RepID=UPI00053C0E71|nr:PREDICTED: B3 domain-containing protein At5g26805 [Tarenaya hassleriana]
MIKTSFNVFLQTKLEEQIQNSESMITSDAESALEVEIRPNPRTLNLFPWTIRKTLTIEDVGFFGGLQLSEEQVGERIFRHWESPGRAKEKVEIVMRDLDTDTYHNLLLRKFPNDKNYTIYEFWIEEFVLRRQLKIGMVIGLYWDLKDRVLCFSVLYDDDDDNDSLN